MCLLTLLSACQFLSPAVDNCQCPSAQDNLCQTLPNSLTTNRASQPLSAEQSSGNGEATSTSANTNTVDSAKPNASVHSASNGSSGTNPTTAPKKSGTSANGTSKKKTSPKSGSANPATAAQTIALATPPAAALPEEKPIIGRIEYIFIKPDNFRLKARIDTGAGVSSLNALNLVAFERDGKPWVRFSVLEPKSDDMREFEKPVKRYINIKQLGEDTQRRPVIELTFTLGTITEQVDVTLTDRTGYVYQMLVGRNFLRDRAVVDVSRKFIAD